MVRPSQRGDAFLILLSFLLAGACVYFLYFRSFLGTGVDHEGSVAHIDRFEKTVKLKKKEVFTWFNASEGQELVGGDKLYTHEQSSAQVKFKSGDLLSLNPFSLVEITEGNKGIKLEKGSFTATLADDQKPITLVLGDRTFNLSGKDSEIRIQKNGEEALVTVLKGEVSLEGKKQKIKSSTFKLEKNTNIEKITVKGFSYELLIGEPAKTKVRVIIGQSIPITIKALSEGRDRNSTKPTLLITDPNGTLSEKQISTNQTSFLAPRSGTYSFQLKDNEEALSAKRELLVEVLPLAQIRVPPEEKPLYPNKRLPFELKSSYPVKMAIYTEDQRLLLSKDLPSTIDQNKKEIFKKLSLILKEEIPSGAYEFHVSPEDILDSSLKVIHRFSVQQPPILLAPQITQDQDHFIFYGKGDHFVKLTWQTNNRPYQPGTLEAYSLEVQGEGKSTTVKDIEDNHYLWRTPDGEGTKKFSWKIKAIQTPFDSPYSAPRSFSVTKKSSLETFPMTGAVLELEKPQQEVSFEWEKVSAKGYLLEVSKEREFREPLIKKETQNHLEKVTLPEAGVYFWRTRIIDQEGNLKLGSPRQIIIKPAPAPKPLRIKEKQRIKLKRKKVSLTLSPRLNLIAVFLQSLFKETKASPEGAFEAKITWPKERLAKKYLLRVRKDDKILLEVTTETPQYLWQEARPGTYQYEVAIIDFWERTGEFSNAGELILEAPKPEIKEREEIDLLAPSHRQELRWNKTTFEFRGREKESATIEFSTDLDFKAPLLSLAVKDNEVNINTRALALKAKGSPLYWRVTQGKEGKKGNFIKSKRRLISFHQALTQKNKRNTSKDLNYGDFEISQTTSQTSYEQVNPGANIKASGMTMLHLGLHWKGRSIDFPFSFSLERAQGAAFESQSYNQSRLQFFYERYGYLFERPWTQKYGVEYQIQTFFLEQRATIESEEVGLFLGATVQELELSENSLISLKLALGQGLNYALQYRHSLFELWSYKVSLGIHYEGLSVTGKASDYEKDITRSNMGLSWFLEF